jgi:hypothetical protein
LVDEWVKVFDELVKVVDEWVKVVGVFVVTVSLPSCHYQAKGNIPAPRVS